HRTQVGAGEPSLGEGVLCGADREVLDRHLPPGPRPGADAGALGDPLVRGADRAHDVVVGHQGPAAHTSDGEDAAARHRRRLGEGRLGHRVSSVLRVIRSAAASRSSGLFRATVCTPRMLRRARPASTPPGASSTAPLTPLSRLVAWHRSHRTGEEICATRRSSAWPPEPTGAPSALDSSGTCGSAAVTCAAAERTASTAGAMWLVW